MAFSRDPDRPRRSWARRILITFNVLLAVILVGGVGGVGYVKWRYGQVGKIDLGSVLRGDDENIGDEMNVLLVGSDTRATLTADDQKSYGDTSDVAGQRSDTIMVVHIDPKAQRAAILSFPRDLWVPIAGTSGKQRINTAFDKGPQQLIQTISNDFDIPIDHYAQVDFEGFKGVVDSLGGVKIPFSAPARDYDPGTRQNLSGLNIQQTGCVQLSGQQALSYVRSRHYQSYEGGRWVSDPRSDLSRIDRQQDFIRRVMHKAVDKATNPFTLNAMIGTGVKYVQVDKNFSLGNITSLAKRFKSLDPNTVEMMTIPNTSTTINGASVLLPNEAQTKETVDRFLNGDPKATATDSNLSPSSVSIRVLNGSGQSGQASETSGSLKDANFVVSGTGDYSTRITTTQIRYATGQSAKADLLAKYVRGSVTKIEDKTIKGNDITLVTGSAFGGIDTTGSVTTTTAAPAPAPSTTASPFVPSAAESCD